MWPRKGKMLYQLTQLSEQSKLYSVGAPSLLGHLFSFGSQVTYARESHNSDK